MKKGILVLAAVLLALPAFVMADQTQWDTVKIESSIKTSLAGKPLEIKNPKTNELLQLTLSKVHPHVMQDGTNAAVCADFKDAKGQVYDIDFTVDPSYKVLGNKFHK